MLVLRKNDHVRERTRARPHSAEMNMRNLPALDPEVHVGERESALDDGGGKPDLPIELERSGVDREGARRGAGFSDFIDDPDAYAAVGEPQRKRKAGRSGAGDQDIGVGHESRRSEVAEKGARRAKYILRSVTRALTLSPWQDPVGSKFILSISNAGKTSRG